MTEYDKEMAHDMVMLSDNWTAKIDTADPNENWYHLGIDNLPKRMRQLFDRMDRNFGD